MAQEGEQDQRQEKSGQMLLPMAEVVFEVLEVLTKSF